MKKLLPGFLLFTLLCSACAAPASPSDADILAEFAAAKEAAAWFEVCTARLDFNEQADVNGNIYHRVSDFETYDDFTAYLGGLFADPLIEAWLASPTYTEIDGKLYAMDMARGTDIGKGEETCEVIRESKTKYILRVTVELLDYGVEENMDPVGAVVGYETHDFPYEYTDGDWVFTAFPVIR